MLSRTLPEYLSKQTKGLIFSAPSYQPKMVIIKGVNNRVTNLQSQGSEKIMGITPLHQFKFITPYLPDSHRAVSRICASFSFLQAFPAFSRWLILDNYCL